MDKNIKAELWTLRNEVLTNLKNIEGLVGKIDNKLADEDETSCLSRCPEIAKLLDICHVLNLHPDTPQHTVLKFKSLVNRATDRLSVAQADRYADNMAELISICKKIDTKVGKLPAESPMEALWESQFPGVREKVEEYLKENDPVMKPKTRPVEVDDEDVKNALDRMNARLDGKSENKNMDPDADPDLAPKWAKDVDNKSSLQIWKEAAEWDEDAHMLFGRMWNHTAVRRIALMEEVIRETIEHVNGYNYYSERVTIKNQDDIKDLMARYDALEKSKEEVIGILSNFDRETINDIIKDTENSSNWIRYYDWNDRMIKALEEVAKRSMQGQQVASSCHTMLKFLSKPKEMQVWDPMTVDRNTLEFGPMKMPADKLEAYRKRSHDNYMRDLKRAYEWEARQKALEKPDESKEDEIAWSLIQ